MRGVNVASARANRQLKRNAIQNVQSTQCFEFIFFIDLIVFDFSFYIVKLNSLL